MSEATTADNGYRSVGRIRSLYANIGELVTKWVFPLGLLWARIHIGWIFFKSGWGKLEYLFKGEWSTAVSIMEETPIPGLSADVTAPLTTAAEIILPIMLVLGIFGRIGAGGLLVMAIVIEFIVAQTPKGIENEISSPHEHMIWMILAGLIVLRGPGWLSLDHLLLRTEKK